MDKQLIKSADGLNLYLRSWALPDPKAVVVLVHGLGEHISRYEHLAAYFNANQIAVCGFDHRGHGRSEGKRGFTPTLEHIFKDIEEVLSRVKAEYASVPLFLYGHSMGGNLVLNYVLKYHPAIAGVIVTGSFIKLAFQPSPFIVTLGKVMRSVYPGFTQSNQLDLKYISRESDVVAAYKQDPLVHDRLSASLGTRLLDHAGLLLKYAGAFPYPLLIMHGAADKITSPEGSRQFAQRVTGDITFREWEGMYHEIHNEKEQQDVFNYTINWIKNRI